MIPARLFRSSLSTVFRELARDRKLGIRGASGMTEGYKKASIVILHRDLADDFEAFCHANSGPLPLLYRSQPGELTCPVLTHASDVRTLYPEYFKYEQGNLTSRLPSLLDYSEELANMVTFYLGTAMSDHQKLQRAEVPPRPGDKKHAVSIYKTSVPCCGVGNFQCDLRVFMKPMPERNLDTHLNHSLHGVPVHIGHPGLIGVEDLRRPDNGDAMEVQPGDVPVFWACGTTGGEAVRSSKTPLSFTCSTDLSSYEDGASPLARSLAPSETPLAFCISQQPLHYSLASAAAVQRIRALETHIGADPGERGIKALLVPEELLKASLSLSHAASVLITTGFPTHFTHNPPEENDGPPGAIAMAAMLQALNKRVTIVTDHRALDMNRKIIEDSVEQGILKTPVPVLSFQNSGADSVLGFLCHNGDPVKPRYDHLVAIERAGMAADGNYYNARKVNIKHLVDPIDILFTTASSIPGITTTGIGDGGNELGMGKVREAVRKHVPNGELIACDVAADFAITAGVSNWGGYAVACALYVLNHCPVHERYLRRAVGLPRNIQHSSWTAALPTVRKEEKILEILVKYGIRSGRTGTLGMEVDGLPFHSIHSAMIQRLIDMTLHQAAL
ncbi:D-glutamate cyclase, mitochondrial-like isoform X1 [Lepisosteus oculatus]|uniref:D-glutamate cyclase, mitochondrial-like isoform X1 n=1 Tax=Lepisosteus oculatus TaxID=7918 RepID=UPI0037228E4F